MDYKKLIPDFSVIAKTDWAKPNLDTKNKTWLIMAGAALLMVVFAFIPWQTVTQNSASASTLGVATWYGFLGLLSALVVVYGVLYNQVKFVFCGAVLGAVLGLLGALLTTGVTIAGVSISAEVVKAWAKATKDPETGEVVKATVSHIGAILFLVASLAAAAVSFLQIKKENE